MVTTTDSGLRASRKRSLALASPWLMLVFVIVVQLKIWLQPWWGDFKVYYSGGQALREGFPIYELIVHVTGQYDQLPFTYPVFAAVLIVPFTLLSEGWAALAFSALSMAALVATCFLVARVLPRIAGRNLFWSTRELTVVILACALMMGPVLWTFYLGQVGALLMFLVVADFLLLRKRQGVLVGLAAGIKVTPGVFIALYLMAREWRKAAVALGVFAATVVIGWLVQPDQAFGYWTGYLFDTSRVGDAARPDNTSLLGVLTRLTSSPRQIWLPIALVIFVAGLYLAYRWYRKVPLIAVLVVALTVIVVSPISWSHHLIWLALVLPVLVALTIRAHRQRDRAVWYACLAASILVLVSTWARADSAAEMLRHDGLDFGPQYQILATTYLVCVLMVLVAFAFALRLYRAESEPLADNAIAAVLETAKANEQRENQVVETASP